MNCPKCHAAIESPSNFCPYCGVDLHKRRSHLGWITLITLGALLAAVAAYFIAPSVSNLSPQRSTDKPTRPPSATKSENTTAPQSAFQNPDKSDALPRRLVYGRTAIYDIAGNLMYEIPAVVVANGWLAFPVDVCIGGYLWQFTGRTGDVFEIAGGIIGEKDEMGIWQLDNDSSVFGPQLSTWFRGQTLGWTSAVSQNLVKNVPVTILSRCQRFL